MDKPKYLGLIINMVLYCSAIGLGSCKEAVQEAPSCDAGFIQNEQYINQSCGLRLQLPEGWDQIPDSVLNRNREIGSRVLQDTAAPNSGQILLAIQDARGAESITLQLSCLNMSVVGKYTSAPKYADYSLEVINRAKNNFPATFTAGRDAIEYGSQKFERVWMNSVKGENRIQVDSYYLFRNSMVLAIVASYKNSQDSSRVDELLNSIVFESDSST